MKNYLEFFLIILQLSHRIPYWNEMSCKIRSSCQANELTCPSCKVMSKTKINCLYTVCFIVWIENTNMQCILFYIYLNQVTINSSGERPHGSVAIPNQICPYCGCYYDPNNQHHVSVGYEIRLGFYVQNICISYINHSMAMET